MAIEVEIERRVFTVDEYDRLVETGFFRPDERLELIEGQIVTIRPIGMRHAACVGRLTDLLGVRVGPRGLVWVQNPVVLGTRDEFQPDVAVLRRREDYYATARPGPSDVLLLIEVADATLTYDRSVKISRYATAGLSEVWLVDLQRDVVLIYQTPTAEGYTSSRTAGRGEQLVPLSLAGVQIGVDEILGELPETSRRA